MSGQVSGTEAANGEGHQAELAGIEQCTGGVGGGENPYSHIGLCAKPLQQCRSSDD